MKSIWKFRNPFEIQIKYVMVKILVSVKFRHTSGRSQERPLGYQQCSAVQLAMPDCKINWVGWYQNIYINICIYGQAVFQTPEKCPNMQTRMSNIIVPVHVSSWMAVFRLPKILPQAVHPVCLGFHGNWERRCLAMFGQYRTCGAPARAGAGYVPTDGLGA